MVYSHVPAHAVNIPAKKNVAIRSFVSALQTQEPRLDFRLVINAQIFQTSAGTTAKSHTWAMDVARGRLLGYLPVAWNEGSGCESDADIRAT